MAFEKLYECTNSLFDKYDKLELDCDYWGSSAVLQSAMIYYQTVLSMAKFRSQRASFEERLFKSNPGFYKGYFKKSYPGGPKIKN